MDIKKSYVYKGIRKAAVESLLSPVTIFCCICMVFLVFWIYGLFFEFDLDENPDFIFIWAFFALGFFLFTVMGIQRLVRGVTGLFSPEDSIAATRYMDFISFEEMCERVEAQYLQPLLPMRRWGINALADFILYEKYATFAVIPYSAILDVQPVESSGKDFDEISSPTFYVEIQDTLSNQYLIQCANCGEQEELLQTLKKMLQWMREEKHYLY